MHEQLPILEPGQSSETLSLQARLLKISAELRLLSEDSVRSRFGLSITSILLKSTISVCDLCLKHVPAAVFKEGGKVLINKDCSGHGIRQGILENDADYYHLSSKDQWGRPYTNDNVLNLPAFSECCGKGSADRECGDVEGIPWITAHTDQTGNKSCTVLVEITDACNLNCRVCYSDSKGDRILPLEQFKQYIRKLVAAKGRMDSIQITGGEAGLHPQFWQIVDWLYHQPEIEKIYLPTNGIKLEKDETPARLRRYRDKILVLLQFDAGSTETNQALRRSDTRRIRESLIYKLDRAGIAMQLTMTIASGLNENEIAWVVRQGIKHKHIRLIGLLPVFYSGRYELPKNPLSRMTLSDVVKAASEGTKGKAAPRDFMPIPCSHPNCGWTTLFARRFGLFFNIARAVDLGKVIDDVAYKTILQKDELRKVIGSRDQRGWRSLANRMARWLIRPSDVFGIAIKPFMDAFNYDQDRISSCCHHMLNTHGELVSFCEYNALFRRDDAWDRFPKL